LKKEDFKSELKATRQRKRGQIPNSHRWKRSNSEQLRIRVEGRYTRNKASPGHLLRRENHR